MLTMERGPDPLTPRVFRRRRDTARRIGGGLLDIVAVVGAAVLIGLGLLNLYATGGRSVVDQQLAGVAVGGVLLIALVWLRGRYFRTFAWTLYVAALVLLVAVRLFGVETAGARRWLVVGGVSFQPSELAKLGLLLVLAHTLGSRQPPLRRLVTALMAAAPPIALILAQPDLSTTLLLTAMTAAMLLLGRIPWRFLMPLFAAAAVAAPLLISMLRPYQLERIQAFTSGALTGDEPGWAVYQAHIAMSWGGLFGTVEDPRYPILAQYLAEREHDLALASLVHGWGLVAAAVALAAAALIIWRLVIASRTPYDRRGSLVAAGFAALFSVEIVVSVGGNLGLLPLAGVPFPFLGLGGTSVAIHLAALGAALGVRREGARRRQWVTFPPRYPGPRMLRTVALAVTSLLVAFSAYGWNLVDTQGAELRAAGEDQMTRCIRIPAPRGSITDRHGTMLASDAEERYVVAIPALLLGDEGGTSRVAELTGQPVEDLRATLEESRRRLSLRIATVSSEVAVRVDALGLPGAFTTPAPRRIYSQGSLLGPMLGFVGVATPADERRWPGMLRPGEVVGRAGLEQQYDPVLRGVPGKQCVYVNPPGVPVALAKREEPVPGSDLRLSLDLGLQRKLTAELVAGMRNSGGDMGAAVIMDPRDGQVLAMASAPSYDNNVYGPPLDQPALLRATKGRGYPTLEHVTQTSAPPGSVFKIAVAAANAVDPVISPRRVIPTGDSFTYRGHRFGNWRPLPPQNMYESIAWSNNVYFYKLAVRMGPQPIHDVATALGAGGRTGIDLPGEVKGFVGTPDKVKQAGGNWYPGSTVLMGIGQGPVTATPLQASVWTASIASGQRVTPRLGLALGSEFGGFQALPRPEPVKLPFAGKLQPVRDGMRMAATSGTAARLSQLPVQAGGKTGSAEDPASPNGKPHSWFTAAAPIDNPEVVATSFVRGGGFGSATSGPVVVETLKYYYANKQAILSTGPTSD